MGVGTVDPGPRPASRFHVGATGDEIGAFITAMTLTLTAIAGHAGIPQLCLPAGKVRGMPGRIVGAGHYPVTIRALLDLGVRHAAAIGMA